MLLRVKRFKLNDESMFELWMYDNSANDKSFTNSNNNNKKEGLNINASAKVMLIIIIIMHK